MRVHFLDSANDLVANITDEDSTRVGDRAARNGRSKRLGRRRIALCRSLVRGAFEKRVQISDFGSGLGVEAIEILLNAL